MTHSTIPPWSDPLAPAAELRAQLEQWCREYGVTLCPPAGLGDSFGDGMREAKRQIRAIVFGTTPPRDPVERLTLSGDVAAIINDLPKPEELMTTNLETYLQTLTGLNVPFNQADSIRTLLEVVMSYPGAFLPIHRRGEEEGAILLGWGMHKHVAEIEVAVNGEISYFVSAAEDSGYLDGEGIPGEPLINAFAQHAAAEAEANAPQPCRHSLWFRLPIPTPNWRWCQGCGALKCEDGNWDVPGIAAVPTPPPALPEDVSHVNWMDVYTGQRTPPERIEVPPADDHDYPVAHCNRVDMLGNGVLAFGFATDKIGNDDAAHYDLDGWLRGYRGPNGSWIETLVPRKRAQ